MALELYANGFGSVFASEPRIEDGYCNTVDDEKMKAFFASKGYKFVRGKKDEEQDIYWKDGLPFGSDYILDLIEQGNSESSDFGQDAGNNDRYFFFPAYV